MEAIIKSQLGYCCSNRTLDRRDVSNKAIHLHERSFRIVYKGISFVEDLLKRDKSFKFYQKNIQLLLNY